MNDSGTVPRTPNPARSAASRAAMRRRWGPQRVLRLDQLDPVTAGIIRAILDAQASAAQREAVSAIASETAQAAGEHGHARSVG